MSGPYQDYEGVISTPLPVVPDALCRQVDPALWFPAKGESNENAIRICGICPERLPCYEFAIENGELWGIWAGTTERERQKIRLQRAEDAAA